MSLSVIYHGPSTTSHVRKRYTRKHPAQVYGLCTDKPAIRPPTNHMLIRPKWGLSTDDAASGTY